MTGTNDAGTYLSAARSMTTAAKNRTYAPTTFAFRYSRTTFPCLSVADFLSRTCEMADIDFDGLQSFFLGLIGEYIGKNYLDQNGTPQWAVKGVYEGGVRKEKI